MWNYFMDCKKTQSRYVRKLFRRKYVQSKLWFSQRKMLCVMQHRGLNGGLQLSSAASINISYTKAISLWKRESCSCLCFLYIMLYNDISTPECPLLYGEAYNTKSSHKGLWCVVHNMSRNTMPLFWKWGKIFLHCQNFSDA